MFNSQVIRVIPAFVLQPHSNASSINIAVVGEGRIWPVIGVRASSFLECFDAVGWVTEGTSGPLKPVSYFQRFCYGEEN